MTTTTEHLTDVDKLQAKDLLQIAETIERRPVLGHWPHMRAASDAEAVRRAAGEVARLRLREKQLTEALVKRRERIGHLQREIDTCGLQCSATMKSLLAENEQLRTALTGISTCSTCEACRGAALRALGGETACVHPFTKLGIDGDGVMWCTECQTKPLVIPTPWRDAETTGEGQ